MLALFGKKKNKRSNLNVIFFLHNNIVNSKLYPSVTEKKLLAKRGEITSTVWVRMKFQAPGAWNYYRPFTQGYTLC